MKHLHIKNLDQFNPNYKDRSLIWCKVYFSMINSNPDFEMVCEIDKWRFICFIMLEIQLKKPVPLDEKYLLRKGFDFKARKLEKTIQSLCGCVEVVDIDNVTQLSKVCEKNVTQSRVDKSRVEYICRFTPPTLDEISAYCKERKNHVDTNRFFDFYQSKGWMVGKNKMKDWKACVRTWEKNSEKADPKRADLEYQRTQEYLKQLESR